MNFISVAQICYEANRTYSLTIIGECFLLPWQKLSTVERFSYFNKVKYYVLNSTATASTYHENWVREQVNAGWIYAGVNVVKDDLLKTDPKLVPFDFLPIEDQAREYLFRGIVEALLPYIDKE